MQVAVPPQTRPGQAGSLAEAPGSPAASVVEATSLKSDSQDREASYASNRESLLGAIAGVRTLLTDLDGQQAHGTIHYPHELGLSHERAAMIGPSRAELRRAASMSFEGPNGDEAKRPSMHAHSASTPDGMQQAQPSKHPLSILSIDLRAGQTSQNAIVASLSQGTISQILGRSFQSAIRHLDRLHARVQDTSSRILITGDLNAGKSTFVNALLRRNLMPIDQQPCTNVFCEVLRAATLNGGNEEVHAIRHDDIERYAADNGETFRRFALSDLESVCMDGADDFALLKVYVNDACEVDTTDPQARESPVSFVNNGLVNIALIDAPGLNRDTLSTTALFARQSEIDVVVFVVSAENHFTLSAKEFLWNASREKAYVFVVVNKWAAIRDKARCERLLGQQIQQLSPGTWESRSELVHFIEADDATTGDQEAFEGLEASLRSFVLLKRAKSKLAPARHYVLNLLTDLGLLSDANLAAAEQKYREAEERLEVVKPYHEGMQLQRQQLVDDVSRIEDAHVQDVKTHARAHLDRVVATLDQPDESLPKLAAWTELWSWTSQLKAALLAKVENVVIAEEEYARASAIEGVAHVKDGLGQKYLADEQRQKDERIFRPQIMFSRQRRARALKRPSASNVGLAATADFEISVLDLVDFYKILPIQRSRKVLQHAIEEDATTTLSTLGLGVGALSAFGSQAIGIRGVVDTLTRLADTLGNIRTRKLAGPIFAVLAGLLAWHIVSDLPHAVPRNIARRLQAALVPLSDGSDGDVQSFAAVQADSIASETRKVLRLAAYDLQERFRSRLEHCENERREIETSKKAAAQSKNFFLDFGGRVDAQDANIRSLTLSMDARGA